MSLHDDLWKVHRPTLEEFKRDGGWTEHTNGQPDCSSGSGCKWWVSIYDDFGVCTNQKSCRAGQLTFDNWGCFDFEC